MSYTYTLPAKPHARGAQGEVYFATRSDGHEVAVKVASEHPSAAAALASEVEMLKACAKADVIGVVEVLDFVRIQGRPALVMPRYPRHLGEWLQGVLDAPTADSLGEILEKCGQLARILSAVHRVRHGGAAMLHRDVKPENVFLDHDGQLVLGDFGGAMGIDGLRAVELAVFGTPMWAPFDQILPGRAMPDPTWDTYALCVILFAGLTKARPAYQADPRGLLTSRGRELWETARRATSTEAAESRTLRAAFHTKRKGASAADLVDFTGRSALTKGDRKALDGGIAQLAGLAGLDPRRIQMLQRGCWNLLVRGLSPASHPSPPNRYRDAEELAEQLEDLQSIVQATTSSQRQDRLRSLVGSTMELDALTDRGELASLVSDGPRWGLWIALTAVVGAAAGGWMFRAEIEGAVRQAGLLGTDGQITIPGRIVTLAGDNVSVPSFMLDRNEVTLRRWAECVTSEQCEDKGETGELPVTGLSFDEASTFCTWAGGRLPSEAEYRAATAGGPWPWGQDSPTCAHAIALGCDGLAPVGSTPLGTSEEGVLDLAGNAWEWSSEGLLLGGSADSGSSELGRRGRIEPTEEQVPPTLAGVRCAYDL